MRILLISPLLTKRKPAVHNVGLSYVAAALLSDGHDVNVLDVEAYKYSKDEVISRCKEANPDVIGIGTLVTGYMYVKWLCNALKENLPGVPIILGNSIATTIPEIAMNNLNIDYIVRGEGEETIKELVKTIGDKSDISKVAGICYRKDGKIEFTAQRELIQDLDTIPMPAWHLFPFRETYHNNGLYPELPTPFMSVLTTRGCPFICTYCYHPFQNQKVRFHSSERIVAEIKYLVKEYGIRGVHFVDDLFVVNKKRIIEFCDLLDKEQLDIKWGVTCRSNLVDEELMARMQKSGCIRLGIGVESASPVILENIKKKVTVEDHIRAMKICKKLKLRVEASYMIGNVGETRETAFETVRFRKKYDPAPGTFFFTTPYPDTDLYKYALEKGLIKDEMKLIESYGEQNQQILVNFTDMTNEELMALRKEANKAIVINYILKNPLKGSLYVFSFVKKMLCKKRANE